MTTAAPSRARTSRRSAARRHVALACQAVRERDFRLVADRTLDLSPEGVLLPVDRRVGAGEAMIVSFEIPGAWIDAEATVTRVIEGRRPGDDGLAIGVRFDVIAPSSRAALAAFLHGRPPPLDSLRGMTQRTLVLLKPDAVRRGLVGEIIRRIEAKGYTLAALDLRDATPELLAEHYEEHQGKPFYEPLVDFMLSGPVVAMVLEGVRCIEGFRSVAGATDPTVAAPGTVRGDLGRDWGLKVQQNLVHGSDSPESAEREIGIWFPNL